MNDDTGETTADFLEGMAEDARKRATKWYEDQEDYFAAKASPDEDPVYADAMAHAAGMRAHNEEMVAVYLAWRAAQAMCGKS